MKALVRRIRNALTSAPPQGEDIASELPPSIPHLIYVVGDIHGRLDLLLDLYAKITHDANQVQAETVTTVYVGDYIDRGPESAGCVNLLRMQTNSPHHRFVHLLGNHEEMMLGFIDGDLSVSRIWLNNGGRETLHSFGVKVPLRLKSDVELEQLHQKAIAVIPADTVDWMRALPRLHQLGQLVVVHAGLDPERSLDDQEPDALTWGHPKFMSTQRADDIWVAYGHLITRPAQVNGRLVAVDTGAYRSGELTAAVFAPDHPVRFIAATEK